MVKKNINGLPSSSFNNLVVKKLKTYTSHSQLPRWRYNETKKKKKYEKMSKEEEERNKCEFMKKEEIR
jgi:hypothetical protein